MASCSIAFSISLTDPKFKTKITIIMLIQITLKANKLKWKTTGIWDADAANEAFKLRAGAPCQQVKFYLLQIFIYIKMEEWRLNLLNIMGDEHNRIPKLRKSSRSLLATRDFFSPPLHVGSIERKWATIAEAKVYYSWMICMNIQSPK